MEDALLEEKARAAWELRKVELSQREQRHQDAQSRARESRLNDGSLNADMGTFERGYQRAARLPRNAAHEAASQGYCEHTDTRAGASFSLQLNPQSVTEGGHQDFDNMLSIVPLGGGRL